MAGEESLQPSTKGWVMRLAYFWLSGPQYSRTSSMMQRPHWRCVGSSDLRKPSGKQALPSRKEGGTVVLEDGVESLVHVRQECLVVLNGQQDILGLIFRILGRDALLVLKTLGNAVFVVLDSRVNRVNETGEVLGRKALLANDFHRLVEALVHLGKGVNGGLGRQHLKKLVHGRRPQPIELVRGASVFLYELRSCGTNLAEMNLTGSWKKNAKPGRAIFSMISATSEAALENLGVDDQELNGHVLVLHGASSDTNHLALERDKFPAILLLDLLNLVIVVEELNVSLGAGELEKRRHDIGQEGKELLTEHSAHAAPAVHQVLGLRIVGVRNVLLDGGKKLDKSHGILAKSLLSNCQSNQSGALHSLGAEEAELLVVLPLQNTDQQRHQSVVVLGECGLGSVSNGCNGRQGLLLDVALLILQQLEEVRKQLVEVGLQDGLLGLLAEVDQGSSGVRFDASLGRLENRNDGLEHAVVVVGLHLGRKVGAHLTQRVAASPTHTRVRVLQCGNNEVKDLAELADHQFPAAFGDGRDGHEGRAMEVIMRGSQLKVGARMVWPPSLLASRSMHCSPATWFWSLSSWSSWMRVSIHTAITHGKNATHIVRRQPLSGIIVVLAKIGHETEALGNHVVGVGSILPAQRRRVVGESGHQLERVLAAEVVEFLVLDYGHAELDKVVEKGLEHLGRRLGHINEGDKGAAEVLRVPTGAVSGLSYLHGIILEALLEGLDNGILVLLLDDPGGRSEDAESGFALLGVGGDAELEKTAQELGPGIICHGVRLKFPEKGMNVLSRDLSDGVADFIPHSTLEVAAEALEKLLANGGSLFLGQGQEHVDKLAALILAALGGDSPEDDGGKGSYLKGGMRVVSAGSQDEGSRKTGEGS
ncbi:LOW QUALITY PROTEIN: hypothetical protein ColTof3_11099 [Colletotrichum tofieldiae]|nr:LOW QUALITY PROTEIN: hypothetical protein ColTof3_11099 [Colletotrichum tofieldiae]